VRQVREARREADENRRDQSSNEQRLAQRQACALCSSYCGVLIDRRTQRLPLTHSVDLCAICAAVVLPLTQCIRSVRQQLVAPKTGWRRAQADVKHMTDEVNAERALRHQAETDIHRMAQASHS
jgi:hypothetical protein